jgi:hypothetical protein
VILFAHLDAHEVTAIKEILQIFVDSSGLWTNMAKCSITYGSEATLGDVQEILGCQVTAFPIRYLGLPLSMSKIPRAEIRRTVEAVARRLPAFHGPLMAKSGMLI